MLDYVTVKKPFADKFASDDFESAFYHTIKHVYEQGVKDGEVSQALNAPETKR